MVTGTSHGDSIWVTQGADWLSKKKSPDYQKKKNLSVVWCGAYPAEHSQFLVASLSPGMWCKDGRSFTGLGDVRTGLFFWQFSPLAMEEDMLLLVVHNCAQGIGQKVMQGVWWTKMSMADELPGNLTWGVAPQFQQVISTWCRNNEHKKKRCWRKILGWFVPKWLCLVVGYVDSWWWESWLWTKVLRIQVKGENC